jgi:hypothetical protein
MESVAERVLGSMMIEEVTYCVNGLNHCARKASQAEAS